MVNDVEKEEDVKDFASNPYSERHRPFIAVSPNRTVYDLFSVNASLIRVLETWELGFGVMAE